MDLYSQARTLGILTQFVDGRGQTRVTDEAALKIIIDALPGRAERHLLEGPVVIRPGEPSHTELPQAAKLPVRWIITAGNRVIGEGETDGRTIHWPQALPSGAHRLRLTDRTSASEDVPLIVAPKAFAGEFDRAWLVAVQLYGVRSARNWGMGDFTDLKRLIELASKLGADGVGLNPLHALFDDRPTDCSPYSPNSRLFLNALYVDVEAIPEYRADIDRDVLARLRQSAHVDYAGVAELKWRALRTAFENFRANASAERRRRFQQFRNERGSLLSRFACFEALRHRLTGPWWEWPAEWRQPDEEKLAGLRNGPDRSEIEFVEFVQWTADRQLGACSALADKLGMRVGLYLDVAVGVQSDGFDAWHEQQAISRPPALR